MLVFSLNARTGRILTRIVMANNTTYRAISPRKTGIHHDIDKDYDDGDKEKKQGHGDGFPQLVAVVLIVKRGDPTAAGALSEGLVENVENEWLLAVCTSEPAGSGRGLSCNAAQRQACGRLPSSTIAGLFDHCYYSLAEKRIKRGSEIETGNDQIH